MIRFAVISIKYKQVDLNYLKCENKTTTTTTKRKSDKMQREFSQNKKSKGSVYVFCRIICEYYVYELVLNAKLILKSCVLQFFIRTLG